MVAVVVILVVLAIAFLPFGIVSYNESRSVPLQAGIDHAVLNLSSDIGSISITYQPLSGSLIDMHISAETSSGLLAPQNFSALFNVTFAYSFVGNTVFVNAGVKTQSSAFLGNIQNLSIVVTVSPSLEADVNASTAFGGITFVSGSGDKIDALSLATTTGGVSANLAGGTLLGGDINLKTTTGGVQLLWDNVTTSTGVAVNSQATTGGIGIDMSQSGGLNGSVAVTGTTTTGGVNFSLSIGGDIGARINSTAGTGGINVSQQKGFVGPKDLLNSTNYPADNNFDVDLQATLGGIDISAVHQP